jgi:hypothetical protein
MAPLLQALYNLPARLLFSARSMRRIKVGKEQNPHYRPPKL